MDVLEFQEMMRRIYFHRDSERGTTGTYNWLVEEIEELGIALKEQDHKTVMNEFADVLAWLASLANVVGIDLENAAKSKYNYMCPKCSKSPCECPYPKASYGKQKTQIKEHLFKAGYSSVSKQS